MKPFNSAHAKISERILCRQYLNERLRGIALLVALTIAVTAGTSRLQAIIGSQVSHVETQAWAAEAHCKRVNRKISSANMNLRQSRWQDELGSRNTYWISILGRMLQSVPRDTWLSQVGNLSDGSVSIEGSAASYESVSLFTNRLRSDSMVSDARLVSAKTVVSSSGEVLDFVVWLQVRPAATGAIPVASAKSGSVPRLQE